MKKITLLCALVTACAEPPDEPPDATSPTTIVGTWRWLPNVFHGDIAPQFRDILVFHDDLTYEWMGPDGSGEGDYTYEDRRLTLSSSGATTELGVLLLPDRLLYPAYRPASVVDGAVGIWDTTSVYSGDEVRQRIQLHEDGRCELGVFGGSAWGCTWRELGEAIELTFDSGEVVVFQRFEERAIGQWLLERLE
jgi:hypothetical protein